MQAGSNHHRDGTPHGFPLALWLLPEPVAPAGTTGGRFFLRLRSGARTCTGSGRCLLYQETGPL